MQHDTAIGMNRIQHFFGRRAQRRDDDRYPVLHADLDIMRKPVIRLMHDLVHCDRANHCIRMRCAVRGQRLFNLGKPLVEHLGRARIQRREGADDARLALFNHQLRAAGDKQG